MLTLEKKCDNISNCIDLLKKQLLYYKKLDFNTK